MSEKPLSFPVDAVRTPVFHHIQALELTNEGGFCVGNARRGNDFPAADWAEVICAGCA